MLEAGRIVCHDAVGSSEVPGEVTVSMLPLEAAIEQTETRGGAAERCGSFIHTRDGRGVVASGDDGAEGCRQGGCNNVQVADHAGLFQIAVGDGTIGVFGRDQAALNLGRERLAPEVGLLVGCEEHPSHALFGGVSCPNT